MTTSVSKAARSGSNRRSSARHGPYYEWGHLKGGKLVHRVVSPEQAALLRLAIANYRQARKLLRAWEKETERLIDAEADR
jgi:hypothetical protein